MGFEAGQRILLSPLVSLPAELLDRSGLAISIVRADGLITYVNEATLTMFTDSGSTDDRVGMNLLDLQPVEFFRERLALLKRLARTGKAGVVRDLWQGRQVLTHMKPLPLEPGEQLISFLLIHVPQAGSERGTANEDVFYDAEHQSLGKLAELSNRELEVLALVGQGLSASAIAKQLHRTVETVNSHKAALLKKLRCDSSTQLALIAHNAGLKIEDASRFKRTGE